MRSREHVELLLRKAAQDEFTIDKLVEDPASPDEVIGFHAQQAVEKMLKAVLSSRRIHYPLTHVVGRLIALIRSSGIEVPDDIDDVRRLTPFAAEARYADLPPEGEEPFDRTWAVDCVRRTRAWVESILAQDVGD